MFDIDKYFSDVLESPQIFKNRAILQPEYVPEALPHRDDQLRTLAQIVSTTLKSGTPSNIFIMGKTGTGKTASVKFIAEKLDQTFIKSGRQAPIWIYLNCHQVSTEYRIMANICEVLDPDDPVPIAGWPIDTVFAKMLDKIETYCKNSICFIILDEIDVITKKGSSQSGALYNLIRINERLEKAKVSLIGISNVLNFKDGLDPRVLSSLREETIIFPSYNASELYSILLARSKDTFHEGVVSPDVIACCSSLAAKEHGDARKAIDLLRKAGELTERHGKTVLTKFFVELAQKDLEKSGIKEYVSNLPVQMKLLLLGIYLIENNNYKEEISTGIVYRCYVELQSQFSDIVELSQRRVSALINDLDLSGIINATTVSRGRAGRTKVIKLAVPLQDIEECFQDSCRLCEFLTYAPLCLKTEKFVKIKNHVYKTLM